MVFFFSFTCTNSIQQVYLKSKGCDLKSVSEQHLFFSYFSIFIIHLIHVTIFVKDKINEVLFVVES